jgi:hypothetical protein
MQIWRGKRANLHQVGITRGLLIGDAPSSKIRSMNYRCTVFYKGVVVAYAEEGGRLLGDRFRKGQIEEAVELRKLTFTEQGLRLLPGNYYEALDNGRQFEIHIRNSDGKPEKFARCMADRTDLSQTPNTASLSSLIFWVLEPEPA